MPEVNWDGIEESGGTVPAGEYECRVAEVKAGFSKNHNEMWTLELEVENGPERGSIIYDRLTFTPKAMGRVKLVCGRLGIDTKGKQTLTPGALRGRRARVVVVVQEYVDDRGQPKRRNSVPFDGYTAIGALPPEGESPISDHGEIPF